MTLQTAVEALCNLQTSLIITEPYHAQIKAAYGLPPNRAQSGLPDVPAWINVWGLTDCLNWGQLRIERYAVTSQLLVQDADPQTGARVATAFATEFQRSWDEIDGDLDAQTVGTVLRARDPTIVTMEWGGLSYSGCQFMIDMDVPVVATPEYVDDVIETLQNYISRYFPSWQQDPANWRPTDARPGVYWHRVSIEGPAWGYPYLGFDYSWQGCQVAARIVAPSRIARTMATMALDDMLGKTEQDGMLMPDGSFMQYQGTRAMPGIIPVAEGQLTLDVRFISDDTLPDEDNPDDAWCLDTRKGAPFINPAILTFAEVEANAQGPSIAVYGPRTNAALTTTDEGIFAQATTRGDLHIEFTEGASL
jgi:hypothetical protein